MANLQIILTAARVIISIVFLLYASWSDYKTREVSNRVWMYFAPLALVLSLAEMLLYNQEKLLGFGLNVAAITAIALLLFYAGAFGGADSKALICISLALPFAPEDLFTPVLSGGFSPLAQNIYTFTILSNSVLVAAASAIVMLLLNAKWRLNTGKKMFEGTLASESIGKKILVLATGYKMPIARLQEKWYIYPMEDIQEEDSKSAHIRKLVVMPRDEGRQEIVERLSRAADTEKIDAYVLATPGLPMLIFITVGLLIALLFGDVVWLLIRWFLG
jgi:preflagellin peptidase FlaK